MRISGDLAAAMASQTYYIQMIGLGGKVLRKNVRDNSGTRKLQEGGWRSEDLWEIIKALDVSQNKYLLIRLLPREELMLLLTLLEMDELLNGLKLFTKENLLRLMTNLPKRVLIQMLLTLMPLDRLMKLMGIRELFAILRSKDLKEKDLVKAMALMNPKYIRQILMKMTGQELNGLSMKEMLDMMLQFKKREMLEGMKMMPYKFLRPFVQTLIEQNPELLMMLDIGFVMKTFALLPQTDIIESFRILPPELIIEFLGQLPDKDLALVASQIDDQQFEAYLLQRQPDLLAYLGGLQDLQAA